MITRDSVVWAVAALTAAVGYLMAAERPFMDWGYREWLQALSFGLVWVAGKLSASKLAGANDPLSRTKTVLGLFKVKE